MPDFIQRDGEEVFKEEFLEFAGYNLQRRAIPDARDGIKWGARQLLYSQDLAKLTYDKPFKKAVKSVAQAMGFCYVHGDASAYGTFIRMAKPFAYRYPLQDANGNYGTLINPDDHSASRYVELRGSELASKLLVDIDKETINEWEDTYDMEGQFPKVLPAKGFYGAVNGCISIGSGMSCSIPPTNLKEVNNALITLLNNANASDDEIICYPDFPTGATILNKAEVKESMIRGCGSACKVRATVEYDKSHNCFIVKEMPYSTYTNTICKELANIIAEEPECGIVDFCDYTGQNPDLRIYLSKRANPSKVLAKLYKETSLQTYYTINMVMLDNGTTPKLFGWREMLQAHLDHERIVYRRGFEYNLRKLGERKHVLDGYLICLARIEEVVQTIKKSASSAAAKDALMREYLLDDVQAAAVLKLTLSRLAHLEVEKIKKELTDIVTEMERINKILNDSKLLDAEVEAGLREVAKKFGDDRRTTIINLENEDEEEPVEVKSLQLSLTNKNNLSLYASSNLYTQKRGGVGAKMKMDADEFVLDSQTVMSNDTILLFAQNGNFYATAASNIPLEEKTAIEQLVGCAGERIIAMASLNKKNMKPFIVFITKNGYIKKSQLDEYNVKKTTGVKALTLEPNDEIISVLFLDNEKIGMLSEQGNFLMVETSSIRPIGRVAKGIKGIKLNSGDCVVSGHLIKDSAKSIISVSTSGMIKQTKISEFNTQGTNTKGTRIQKLNDGDTMADFLPINDHTDIMVAATNACIKVNISEIPTTSKAALGVKSIKLGEKSSVVALS